MVPFIWYGLIIFCMPLYPPPSKIDINYNCDKHADFLRQWDNSINILHIYSLYWTIFMQKSNHVNKTWCDYDASHSSWYKQPRLAEINHPKRMHLQTQLTRSTNRVNLRFLFLSIFFVFICVRFFTRQICTFAFMSSDEYVPWNIWLNEITFKLIKINKKNIEKFKSNL